MGMLNEVKSKNKLKAAQNWLKMAENAKTPEKQIEYYTKSLDVNPYNAEAWFRKGRVFEKIGNFEEAKKCFDLATDIDPEYEGLVEKKQYVTTPDTDYEEIYVYPKSRQSQDAQVVEEPEKQSNSLFKKRWIVEDYVEDDSSYKPPQGDESIFSGLGTKESDVPETNEGISDPYLSEASLMTAQNSETPLFTEVPDLNMQHTYMDSEAKVKDTLDANVSTPSVSTPSAASTPSTEADFWKESPVPVDLKEEPELRSVESTEADYWERKIKPVNQTRFKSVESTKAGSLENKARPVKQDALKSPEETKPKSPYMETQSAALDFENGGLQDMDIRIPMSETLKFWAVGIVAIIIASKIISYI